MKEAVIYIHGKGGSAEEAAHYRSLFPSRDVLGFAYKAETPWEAKQEFSQYFAEVSREYDAVSLIANSIGAFFAMQAEIGEKIQQAYFISPVVDMETLITDMLAWTNATEEALREQGEIRTSFGETLSWTYLCYVRNNPIRWRVPTHILYGEKDHLTSFDTISSFAERIGAGLTVMEGGEHWFHTSQQMAYLDRWLAGDSV